jgi:hypothetical protein
LISTPKIRLIRAAVSNQMQVACTGFYPIWTGMRDMRHWQSFFHFFFYFLIFFLGSVTGRGATWILRILLFSEFQVAAWAHGSSAFSCYRGGLGGESNDLRVSKISLDRTIMLSMNRSRS